MTSLPPSVRPPTDTTRRRGPRTRLRAAALVTHRLVGLAIAAFLLVAGLTGTMMAFYPDLDAMLNPGLYLAPPPTPGAPFLDPIEIRERVRAQLPGSAVDGVMLDFTPGRSLNFWIDDQETFVDPYTGEILGRRTFGELREGRVNLLTFLYRVHYSLALGDVGTWLFGVVAVLWTIDCFVGAYLTFPPPSARPQRRPIVWLRRWGPAWRLKTSSLFAGVFTWHRASGLWVWGVLLVFAWSAVGLNLHDEVYAPVMDLVLRAEPEDAHVDLPVPNTTPGLDMAAALARGRALMATEASRRGFEVLGERYLWYAPEHGTYAYVVESTLDVDARLAETHVEFDGDDGTLAHFDAPTGQSTRGTVDAWLVALHFGAVRQGGLAYRTFVAVFGVVVAILSVSGVWIWWRKRDRRAPRGVATAEGGDLSSP